MHDAKQRSIFVTEVAGRPFAADPRKVLEKYNNVEGHDPIRDAKLIEMGQPKERKLPEGLAEGERERMAAAQKAREKAAFEAYQRCIHAARIALDMPEVTVDPDGKVTGYTVDEVEKVWLDLNEFNESLKKSTKPTQTSPSSTASESSPRPVRGQRRVGPAPARTRR